MGWYGCALNAQNEGRKGKHRARNFSRARFLKTLLSKEEETFFVQSTDLLNCSQLWDDDKGVLLFIILLETKVGLGTTVKRRSIYQVALVMGLHLSRWWHDLSVQNILANDRPNIYVLSLEFLAFGNVAKSPLHLNVLNQIEMSSCFTNNQTHISPRNKKVPQQTPQEMDGRLQIPPKPQWVFSSPS